MSLFASQHHKPITLREYIQSYHSLRRVSSGSNITLPELPSTNRMQSHSLAEQVQNKMNLIKSLLSQPDPSKKRDTIMQYFQDLEIVITRVLEKVRNLEDGKSIVKNDSEITAPSLKIVKKKSINKLQRQQQLNSQRYFQEHSQMDELMAPLHITRDIKFSTDLTNMIASTTTQARTPENNSAKKIRDIDATDNQQTAGAQYIRSYVKHTQSIRPIKMKSPRTQSKQIHYNNQDQGQYIIKFPQI